MAAIFVYNRKGGGAWKCLALGRACKLQTCPPHFQSLALPRRILLQTVYWLGLVKLTKGTERAAQWGKDVQPRKLRWLTTTGPAVRFKWIAMGFPKITALASFWNSKLRRFRAWIFMDQSQPRKIQVRICSKHGDFRRKILASNSRKWPCHDPASVYSTTKMSLNR